MKKMVRLHWQSCFLLALASGSRPLAGPSATISGCVTDGNGAPVVHARIVAQPVVVARGHRVHTGKAETKANGCYATQPLAPGTYLLSIKDDVYAFRHIGPAQAKVQVGSTAVEHLDLTTEPPIKEQFRETLLQTLKAANSGFQSPQEYAADEAENDWGTGFASKTIPGFAHCAIHYEDGPEGPSAADWCRGAWMRRDDAANALFARMRDYIGVLVKEQPTLHYVESEGTASSARWVSPINGAISLKIDTSRSMHQVALWVVYNRPLAVQGCASMRQGSAEAFDSSVYDAAILRIQTNVETTVRQQIGVAERNLLRALVLGGPQETEPTPDRVGTFPPPDQSTNCVSADSLSASRN